MMSTTSDTQAIFAGMVRRQLVLGLVLLGLMGLIGARLFRLQVLEQQTYVEAAQRNRLEEVVQLAPRGEILDRNGKMLATTVPRYDVTFYVPDEPIDDWSWTTRLANLLRLPPGSSEGWKDQIEKAKVFTRVELVKDVPLARLIELSERQLDFPGITVATSTKRSYPHAGSTGHLLGYLGAISPAEYERLKPMGYAPNDVIGKGGLEQQYDTHLRGTPGYEYLEVDHRGRVQGRLAEPILLDPQTGRSIEAAAKPQQGPPLTTTIDAELQAAIAKLLTGQEGAVVAMDPRTGELLAAVSTPTYDPNLFGSAAASSDVQALFTDNETPMMNRTLGGHYIPGSTWKIVTAIAGLEEKVITPNTVFNCDGVYRTESRDFRCHARSGHGDEDLRGALADSCDDYFYQLGVRLGGDHISKWAHVLGFGELTGVDLPGEVPGIVPTSEWKSATIKERWYQGDTLNYSMGQGYVLVTPLQLARAYAFVANDGTLVKPHFNAAVDASPAIPELAPSKATLQVIREGLREVVEEGTGRRINFSDLDVSGKTGTADHVTGRKPHSWFASYAPSTAPRVVLVVLVVEGGHGSDAALPIARQIYKLPELHKYLGVLADETDEPDTQIARLQP